ncbi:hypothetical protein [Micromonospora costi]|uniref:Uncharacterized protein n=1 Tax=Micromonospora costi TaxID=1530042 RepID=A0A3B0A5W5_9ACTN|nr:hypothetical protein [Micromonospora costi]RKN56005.1 hypothetical protein D7193_15585 [Micromonospora costi]
MPGKAQALAPTVEQIATDQAVRGDVTESMAEMLTAVRDVRVANVGGRWVIDVSWLARVALDAGLVARVGELDRTVLKLTRVGRETVTRVYAERALAELLRLARRYQQVREEAEADAAEAAAQKTRRHYIVTALAVAAGFTAGALTVVLTQL